METKCLFLFELWVRLISVLLKMYSLVIPSHSSFFIFLPCLPLQRIHFLNGISVSLCQFTLFHWHGVWFTVSVSLCSVCLSFQFFFVSVPPSLLFSKIWHGIETGERLLIFWHTLPFLNQNQLRRNQVITSAVFLLSPSRPFCQFCSRFMKFFTLKWNRGQPISHKDRCKLDLTRDCCINKKILGCEMDVWQGFWMCVWLCVFVCICLPLSILSLLAPCKSHPVGWCYSIWPCLLQSDICDFLCGAKEALTIIFVCMWKRELYIVWK